MKQFQVHPADGHMLEKLLNDMHDAGYSHIATHLIGVKQTENKLMPGKSTAMPMFVCIFERRLRIDA